MPFAIDLAVLGIISCVVCAVSFAQQDVLLVVVFDRPRYLLAVSGNSLATTTWTQPLSITIPMQVKYPCYRCHLYIWQVMCPCYMCQLFI